MRRAMLRRATIRKLISAYNTIDGHAAGAAWSIAPATLITEQQHAAVLAGIDAR
jgi:hypothetical protein